MDVWPADQTVFQLVEKVKAKHHPRLADAHIAVSIADNKAFVNDRFNWGKTSKFANRAKIWHPDDKRYDFEISISADAWNILTEAQREAYIDLRLSCMQLDYEPEVVEENGKKKPVKDKYGRKVYTTTPKLDKNGNVKWKVIPPDIYVITDNVSRYGLWCRDVIEFAQVVKSVKTEVKIEEIINDPNAILA
jgi:hypothetical protein